MDRRSERPKFAHTGSHLYRRTALEYPYKEEMMKMALNEKGRKYNTGEKREQRRRRRVPHGRGRRKVSRTVDEGARKAAST